jgi:hypothetical protein
LLHQPLDAHVLYAVEATCKERAKDRRALATIIRGVPKEMNSL